MDRIMGGGGRSLEKANKVFYKGLEAELRGDVEEAAKRFSEAGEIYASLGERGGFMDAGFLRGHCLAFQALSERSADRFRIFIEEAINVINEIRKRYIKDYALRGVEREAWIRCCVTFMNALRVLLEEDVSAKKKLCVNVVREGDACVEWLERLEESEKAGLLLFWVGIACLRSASWFEGEERVNVLQKAADVFSRAEKFFEAARRGRPYLCLKMRKELCDVRVDVEKGGEGAKFLGGEPKDEACKWIHRYNLAVLELYATVGERFFTERWRRTSNALSEIREVVKNLEKGKDNGLLADAYFLFAVACYEASKITLSDELRKKNIEECYEALRKAYMYARGQMIEDVALRVINMTLRVIAEYVELVESDILRVKLVREGASYAREALSEIKKLPEDLAIIGDFYASMSSFLTAAVSIEKEEKEREGLLRSAIEYGEAALEYEGKEVKRGDYMYCLAKAHYLLGRKGSIDVLEKASEAIRKAREEFIHNRDLVGVVRASVLSGDIQKEIWRKKRGEEEYLRARQEYLEAVRVAAGIEWSEMEGEALVRLAALEDEKGNYGQAVEYYTQALGKFEKLSIKVEGLRGRMTIVEAMINIERGKELLRNRLFDAASYFKKGGELLIKGGVKGAGFYIALSEFLEAEAASIVNPNEALELLRKVSKRLKELKEEGGADWNVDALLKICEGKEHLEEGLVLYAEGASSPALVKFAMAANVLEDAAKLGESYWENAIGYAFFARGLERFIRGRLGAHEEFIEGANFFMESTKKFITSKMKNAALGFIDLCYGWYNFAKYVEGDVEKYVEARTHFERSLKFFMDAGLENLVRYVEGVEQILDGERYIKKLEEEEEAERYFSLAEESYNKAKEKFLEAGYVGLVREVEENVQVLRERETKRRYLKVAFGALEISENALENMKDGFAIVRVNEPADRSLFKVGDRIIIKLEMVNVGYASVVLEKLEGVVPRGFKVIGKLNGEVKEGGIVLNRELAPWEKIDLEVRVIAEEEGEFAYQPTVVFKDNKNRRRYFKSKAVMMLISGG